MANNVFQVKRTSVTGRTPNTSDPSNSTYIAAGELALNMTDGILYSSNGSTLITLTTSGTGLTSIAGAGNVAYDSSRLNNVLAANYVTNTGNYILAGNIYFTGVNTGFANAGFFVGGQPGQTTNSVSTNSSVVLIGNSAVSATINSTVFTGSANNATYLGGTINTDYALKTYVTSQGYISSIPSYVVNTSAAFTLAGNISISGNTNHTGTNNVFGTMYTVGGVPGAAANSVSANVTTILIGNSTVFATINSTSYTGTAAVPSYVVNTSGNFTIAGNLNFNATNTYFTTAAYYAANITIAATGDLVFINGSGIQANGSFGATNQVLTSDGQNNVYWSSVSSGGIAATNQIAWTNTQSFSNTITFNGAIVSTNTFTANSSVGTGGYVLTSGGAGANVYWSQASGGGGGISTGKAIAMAMIFGG
jgi:hypothetical protein